jgi:hypothetical protein
MWFHIDKGSVEVSWDEDLALSGYSDRYPFTVTSVHALQ